MNELTLNINARVRVTLTEAGLRWLHEYYAVLGHEPWNPRGYTSEFSLWQLMHIFGPHVHHGAGEMPFVDNEVILLDPET